ncbi:MAG: hypothetical protein GC160_26190 [Acidobacteria bacterium]|nr:hypothetical protein [Acidobacteriota bacterium]
MIGICILLALAFFVAVGMAALLLNQPPAPDLSELNVEGSQASYRAMERLFSRADFESLAGQPALQKRLIAARRLVLKSYLQQLRTDYLQVWAICRLLAPVSNDPAYLPELFQSYAAFHWRYALLRLHCATGLNPHILESVQQTMAPLTALRQQATGLIHAVDPQRGS